MNRLALIVLLLGSAVCFSGCHVMETPYAPLTHHRAWDPVFGSCGTCGVCGGPCEGYTPAGYLGHKLTCGSGCGEIYWGPWLNDPPDDCDPCDDCGNWVGPRCCEPNLRQRLVAGIFGGHVGVGKGKGRVCQNCRAKGNGGVPVNGTIEVLPHDGPVEVLPPTPEPIKPATALKRIGPRFQLRSVRFER